MAGFDPRWPDDRSRRIARTGGTGTVTTTGLRPNSLERSCVHSRIGTCVGARAELESDSVGIGRERRCELLAGDDVGSERTKGHESNDPAHDEKPDRIEEIERVVGHLPGSGHRLRQVRSSRPAPNWTHVWSERREPRAFGPTPDRRHRVVPQLPLDRRRQALRRRPAGDGAVHGLPVRGGSARGASMEGRPT